MKDDCGKQIFRGIYSEEKLDCGCILKRYVGGKCIREGCATHQVEIFFVCPSCGNRCAGKKASKACAWSHAQ